AAVEVNLGAGLARQPVLKSRSLLFRGKGVRHRRCSVAGWGRMFAAQPALYAAPSIGNHARSAVRAFAERRPTLRAFAERRPTFSSVARLEKFFAKLGSARGFRAFKSPYVRRVASHNQQGSTS